MWSTHCCFHRTFMRSFREQFLVPRALAWEKCCQLAQRSLSYIRSLPSQPTEPFFF